MSRRRDSVALGPRDVGVGVLRLRLLEGDIGDNRVSGREIVVSVDRWIAFLRFGLGMMVSVWACMAWSCVSVSSDLIAS